MKVTLTLAELTALVICRYELPGDATVEIAGMVPTPEPVKYKGLNDVKRILAGMFDPFTGQNILRNVEVLEPVFGLASINYGTVPPEKKIAAIKALRTQIPGLGLADAKYAVEAWGVFMAYVLRNGVPPVNNFVWRHV